jgi:hypothetical protein
MSILNEKDDTTRLNQLVKLLSMNPWRIEGKILYEWELYSLRRNDLEGMHEVSADIIQDLEHNKDWQTRCKENVILNKQDELVITDPII